MALPLAVAVHADRRCYAEALAAYLEAQPQFVLVGYTSEWADAERLCALHPLDAVVVDVAHYSERTLDRLRRLRCWRPALRVVLTCERLPEWHDAALRATGVVSVRYRMGMQAVVTALLGAPPAPTAQAAGDTLTGRELQVLTLISAGDSVTEVAARLGISARTVENHKRHIYAKLQVTSCSGAVSRAVELGLLAGRTVAGRPSDAGRGTPATPSAGGPDMTHDSTPTAHTCARFPHGIALTKRERDILASIAHGDSVRQTARSLGIATKTVENLQSLLYRKLGVRNRVEALAVALAEGLVSAAGEGSGTNVPPSAHP